MRDDSSGPGTFVSRGLAPAPAFGAARLEVSSVVWVVGVCGPADFGMASDGGAGGSIKAEHLALAFFLGEPDAEEPVFTGR